MTTVRRSTGTSRLLLVLAAAVLAAGCASARRDAAGIASVRDTLLLDGMDEPGRWEAVPASGVQMRLSAGEGLDGGAALRVDFDFQGGGGWAALRRALPVSLPENYELSFWLRGDAPENTLEFKLIDGSGENVWWVHRPAFPFAGAWRQVTFRRRHVTFAWGPAGGGEIRDVAAIEFAITAGTGGRGTVWIDRLALTPLEPVLPYEGTPSARATSAAADAFRAVDGDTLTTWRSSAGGAQVLTLDFLQPREYGGLIVHWDHDHRAVDYDVEVSVDGSTWQAVRAVRGGAGPRDYVFMPEMEARWLRLNLIRAAADSYALRELTVQPLEWGESRNTLFETIAAAAPRGHYPRYLTREQSYWTLVGVSGAAEEALINEDGMVEVGKGTFSIEPFLYAGDRLVSWADAVVTQNLRDGYLPIPGVAWQADDLRLDVTAWADGPAAESVLWLRYRVGNDGSDARAVRLFLGLRPFQVNPSWQFLNNPGGVATIRDVAYDGASVRVDDRVVVAVSRPAGFGAARYDEGGVIRWLARGTLPAAQAVTDAFGHASAALEYVLDLAPGETHDVILAVPLTTAPAPTARTSRLRPRWLPAVWPRQRQTGGAGSTASTSGFRPGRRPSATWFGAMSHGSSSIGTARRSSPVRGPTSARGSGTEPSRRRRSCGSAMRMPSGSSSSGTPPSSTLMERCRAAWTSVAPTPSPSTTVTASSSTSLPSTTGSPATGRS
jgi:hypothetical protein